MKEGREGNAFLPPTLNSSSALPHPSQATQAAAVMRYIFIVVVIIAAFSAIGLSPFGTQYANNGETTTRSAPLGASIYDVHKIFGFLTPPTLSHLDLLGVGGRRLGGPHHIHIIHARRADG